MAGLTMVPNVPWHRAPHCKRPPRHKKIFLGYLIVIYIGNQITDIYAIRYHTSTVHASIGYWVYYYTRYCAAAVHGFNGIQLFRVAII